jgi:phosphoglycolate phosphatase-like HAD superfamily hydrolase
MIVALFDIDGTLLASSGAGRLAMDAALAEVFGIRVPILQGSIAGRTDRSIARDQFQLHGVDDTPDNWERFIQAYLRGLPESLVRNEGRALPGVAALLDRLEGRGDFALGLLTGNHPTGARIKLGHCGLDRYFQWGAFGDRHLSRDEVAHEALRLVRDRHGESIALEQVWVIGDTPWDVRCARAIGARAVAVATGIHTTDDLAAERPDLLLGDLAEPDSLWEAWFTTGR